MARLASQAKGGFYASAPEAVAAVLERLRPPEIGQCLILDPCAGQALALLQLADGLEATHRRMIVEGTELFSPGTLKPAALTVLPYGIELSEDRAAIVASLLGEQSLAPCDFFRCHVSPGTFSLAWLNPPYDHSVDDGRVEVQFLHKSLALLVDGGVLSLVCPESVADSYEVAEFFHENFEDISALPFPEEVRKYSETVVLGKKRRPEPVDWRSRYDFLERSMDRKVIYQLPPGRRPKVWKKSEPTDAELVRLVAVSPLRFLLDRPADDENAQRPRPPLSLGAGHRALMMASGFLDGAIFPPGEKPHVIKGTVRKDSYVASCESSVGDDGSETTRTVISEKPVLTIRVLDSRGQIVTLE